MGRLKRLLQWFFGVPRIDRITIARSVLDDLHSMARGAHPNEMLAFFASSKGIRNGHLHIDEIQLQAYYANEDSASVYTSNLPMTTSIVGTVHSHPGGSRRPSEADLHLFSKFGYVHAILGEPYRPENIRFMNKNGETIRIGMV
jgi:proteasome lid subunit RPN8/RPN11